MPSLLFKNVTLYNSMHPVDCFIEDGMIAAVEAGITTHADNVINAAGLTMLPGVMDMHVHFRVPGAEQKEDWHTGEASAFAGGVTTVLDMPNNTPAITTRALLEEKLQTIAAANPTIDYGCYIGATNDNLNEVIASADIACGVKIAPYFVGKDGHALINDADALRGLFSAGLQIPIVVHAEDEKVIAENRAHFDHPQTRNHEEIRSTDAAVSALTRMLLCAKGTKAKLHVTHVSTARELQMIRNAKHEGMDITCDVTPHHLTFTDAEAAQQGGLLKVNPPLRSAADRDALWQGVLDGTVDMIGSDHAPHLLSEKQQSDYDSIPPGVPGVQTLLPVLMDRLSQSFSLDDLVRLTSTAPRARFSRPPILLRPGDTADMVLVDLNAQTTITNSMITSKCGWTPWDGKMLNGKIRMTVRKGEIVSKAKFL